MPQPIRLKDHEKDGRLIRKRAVVGAVVVLLGLMAVLIPGQGGLGAAYAILAYSLLANMALWIFTRYSDR